nr:putative reverse transcriptase domain-containing protein [Tanacetum cinerariifolium]
TLPSDYDCEIRYHLGKANVVADALNHKERNKPLWVRALVMTIGLNLPKQNLEAQIEAQKPKDLKREDVRGMIRKDMPKERDRTFWKMREVNPRYVGPFKVLEKVGSVAYKLELPQELSMIHNTFDVSNLKKCYSDEPLAVLLDGIHIDDKLHFVEELIKIMDREVKRLKQSHIPIVKTTNVYHVGFGMLQVRTSSRAINGSGNGEDIRNGEVAEVAMKEYGSHSSVGKSRQQKPTATSLLTRLRRGQNEEDLSSPEVLAKISPLQKSHCVLSNGHECCSVTQIYISIKPSFLP